MKTHLGSMKISVIGSGYVGLVTGVCLAKFGHKVIFVDVDRDKINKINQGICPIFEKDLDELLKKYKDNISATLDYSNAIYESDLSFICVNTPSTKDGINLNYVEQVVIEIAKILKNKNAWYLVVVKSTVLPGTTKSFVLSLLEKYSNKKVGKDFGLAMNPEFLSEGNAVNDFLKPDRIVIGSYDKKSNDFLKQLYKDFSCPIVETSLSAAEMIKYASNAFLATKISFINEIGNFCKHIGIDTYDVADGMGFDKRIGRAFLDSGIGWGGSCFPKDLQALITLADKEGQDAKIIKSIVEVNDKQPLKLLEILKKNNLYKKDKTFGILGLSFKPNTDDIRDSRAIPIIEKLLSLGVNIKVYDPKAMNNFKKLYPNLIYCNSANEILNTDIILILTKWDEFKKLDYSGKVVIDGRKLEEAKKAKIYEGVCW